MQHPGSTGADPSVIPPVPAADLGRLGAVLRADADAVLHDLPEHEQPDVAGALAYREDRPGRHPGHTAAAVAFRRALSPPLRELLDDLAEWPVRVVQDDDGPTGVLVARPPRDHRHRMRLPSHATRVVDLELGLLTVPEATARRLALPVADRVQRLALCTSLAEAVRFLHERDATLHGLRADRVTFRLDPRAAVRLRVHDVELGTGDPAEDLRTLGLLVLRTLTPGPFRSVARDPAGAAGVLDASGMALLTRALAGDPADRPSADAWARGLATQSGQPARTPELHDVVADRTLVPPGEPVVVSWVGDGVDTVRVAGPGCATVTLPVAGGSGTVTVTPTATGPVVVTAANPAGSVEHPLGRVVALDLPRMGSIPVPAPELPWPDVDRTPLPDLTRVLPPLPPVPTMPLVAGLAGVDPRIVAADDEPRPAFLPVPPPPGFDVGWTAFPVDLTGILTGAPDLSPARRRRRWLFRRRVTM